jgi:uridine kinase
MDDVQTIVQAIMNKRSQIPAYESMLVAISGIDGSGKGYITARIVAGLRQRGINIDGWLNLPPQRFNPERPAEHFYHHAIRFDDMFEQLVLPLKRHRSVWIEANFARNHQRLPQADL